MAHPNVSSVYGPVKSWRLGRSLGVDLLCIDSICSFDCVYCQLGKINQLTTERHTFVPTATLIKDLEASDWRHSDVVTISGSGEPTLALNLGEAIDAIKSITGRTVIVLTNSTLLGDPEVRRDLLKADRVYCKLDAWNDDQLRRINRPVTTISHEAIVDGIIALRNEFDGVIAIQTMVLTHLSEADIARYAKILTAIRPDEVQINIPSRPVPADWEIDNRGNRTEPDDHAKILKIVEPAELLRVADRIEELTLLPVITPPAFRTESPKAAPAA